MSQTNISSCCNVNGGGTFHNEYIQYFNGDKWVTNENNYKIGRWKDGAYIFYKGALEAMGTITYTFVYEDGKYKILSME